MELGADPQTIGEIAVVHSLSMNATVEAPAAWLEFAGHPAL